MSVAMSKISTTFVIIAMLVILGGAFLFLKNDKVNIDNINIGPTTTLDPNNEYITAIDWPPQLRVENTPFSCTQAGSPIERAGGTSRRTIGTRDYCVTEIMEGAAGSIYTQYAYAFASGSSTTIMTFSLRKVQCANYDEPKKSLCEAEQGSFNIDAIVEEIAKTTE